MNFKLITLTLLCVFVFSFNLFSQKADDVIGVWMNFDEKSQIEIYKKEGKYYGKVSWLKFPNEEDGKPKLDPKNPNEKLRTRPRMGMDIIIGFKYDGEEWVDGNIYDPTSGNTFSGYMYFEDKNISKLYLRGYLGFSLVGKTIIWTRDTAKPIVKEKGK